MLKLPRPGDFFYPERRVTHRQVYIRCEWLRGLDNVHLCARDDNGDRKSPPRADLPGGIESRNDWLFIAVVCGFAQYTATLIAILIQIIGAASV